jgi:hypothetical protein
VLIAFVFAAGVAGVSVLFGDLIVSADFVLAGPGNRLLHLGRSRVQNSVPSLEESR